MTSQPQGVERQKVVLIVDDIEDNRILLDRALRSSGYETVHASSGREALAIIAERLPATIELTVVALLIAVETLPDIIRTLGNVTMDTLAAATVDAHAGQASADGTE